MQFQFRISPTKPAKTSHATAPENRITEARSKKPDPRDLTQETWFNGGLTIYQPRQGYRYTMDPLILCSLISPLLSRCPEQIIDIGCGCGIMPLILAYRNPDRHITGVEIQKELATIAVLNAEENRLNHRIRILNQDITTIRPEDIGTPTSLIVANPPYKKKGTGRINALEERAFARHEITLTIDQLFASAKPLLSRNGRICIIFPADRLGDLESAARSSGFFVEWMCNISQTKGAAPFRVVVSAVKNPKASRKVLPPFVLYGTDGLPTKMHKALFNP